MRFRLGSYGDRLRANKAALRRAFDACGTPPHLRALMTAMGMVETTSMSSNDRDATKDGAGSSANVSLFNLSLDIVRCADPSIHDPWVLNPDANLPATVALIKRAVDKWGIGPFLNFVRGGRTAFQDGHSYGAADYRETIATILRQFDADPALLYDDRRVEIDLVHV
jgi:hypothetical protein